MTCGERKRFSIFISNLRQKKGFTLDQVSQGLCTEQMMSYYENGLRSVPKLLQDAILERLGVGAEDYEHYLNYKEYDHWKARQNILYHITYGEMETAGQLLEKYRVTYGKAPDSRKVSDRLERQFCLSMQAQIRCYEGASGEEMYALLEEAVDMSVPRLGEIPLGKRVLSLKEMNLILELERYRGGGKQAERYRELLSYIETADLDILGRAKIYPKAVYFLCRFLAGENAGKESVQDSETLEQHLLRDCNLALECLRDTSRMYYLWELLDMRGRLLDRIIRSLEEKGESQKAIALAQMRRENAAWKGMLESVYAEYGVKKETFSYSYFYVEKGVACINDVIPVRRRMLGISESQLCQGICDIRTLQRLENRKTASRMANVEELFERLGLSREFSRTELVTEEPESREMMERLRACVNEYRTEEAERLHARIKELVPAEIRCNRQALLRQEINLKEERGELAGDEYCRKMRAVLELTLPFEAFLKEGEKYLTYEEQSCIQNMMLRMNKDSRELSLCMERFEELYRPFEQNALIGTVNNMYEFIMEYVGSEKGNQGDFDTADRYNEIIADECLHFRRLSALVSALYDRWWNYSKRREKGLEDNKILNGETELTRCLLFSRLDKHEYREAFFYKKLEAQRGES